MKFLTYLAVIIFTQVVLGANTGVSIQQGHYYKMTTTQIGFHYYYSKEKVFSLKLGQGSTDESNEKEDQYNISLDYKEFQSESFYIGVDLGYYYFREIKKTDDFLSGLFDPEDDYHAIGLTVRFGNEWKLADHFILGCDWIGLGSTWLTSNRVDDSRDGSRFHGVLLNVHATYLF